ncbi:glycerol-3-phosphate responsive antiterminator [Niallia sp.]|uniref:glycerol-3-phosphate responsive antiterminator n=1 Tax=Niallia sp. TaxID=2837523 RepID=UPI00289B6F51|nr:glycerol-3-phosphate responsive antiterminator [Niallia sp.]
MNQHIIPASSNMKEFEAFLKSDYEIGVFLEVHISQLKHISHLAKKANKKMIYHVDLIQGLKSDDFGTEFICQEFKPYGVISTKSSVILKAKQKNVVAIQRVFLLDSHAIAKSVKLVQRTHPDYIEVLPGTMPWMITEIKDSLNVPILAGGLIRTEEDVRKAIEAGATSITTSKKELWQMMK